MILAGSSNVKWLLAVIVLAIVLAFVPAGASPFALRVAQTVLFGAALATAWNILGGFAGYWSFGNAAFLGLGAFTAALLQEHVQIAEPAMRFVLSVAAGGAAATVFALVIGYPLLRLRGAYFAIAMLGVSLVLSELSANVDLFEGALGINLEPVTDAAPEVFFYYVFLVLALGSLCVAALVRYSRLGYGLIAIREDEDTARMLGVPTERFKLLAFVLSALLTGLAGAAYAFSLGYIATSSVFRPDLSFSIIVFALLGGMGTLFGPWLGAAIMTILTQVVLGSFLQVHMMMTGGIIIALVFLLPGVPSGLVA
ncbi:MAG: branched-chain amino acid ABC transporter permease, partial [Rhizobiaceae bacterium]